MRLLLRLEGIVDPADVFGREHLFGLREQAVLFLRNMVLDGGEELLKAAVKDERVGTEPVELFE